MLDNSLAGQCLQSIGLCERPDLDSILQELKSRDKDYLRRFNGAIVQAAFFQATIRKYGSFLKAQVVLATGYDSFQEFERWYDHTPEGKAWAEWSSSAERQ